MDATDPKLGTEVDGRYRLDERLAAGGMGVVYKAEQVGIGKPVAVKFLHEALAGVPDLVRRFQREVNAMSRVAHPHLVSVIDSGVQAGVPYLVMDYQSGKPLSELLDAGPLAAPRAVGIARQVLAGVGHAHASGVVHRDLKPDNIILLGDVGGDFVKILDFGLAKMVNDGAGASQLTNTGFALGTPGYMSPEQARGTPADERADLYAVGVILYHMIVGQKPFVSDSPMAVLRMHMEDAPVAPRKAAKQKLSAELDAAILRALEKEPDKRWASASEFARALEATPEGRASGVPMMDVSMQEVVDGSHTAVGHKAPSPAPAKRPRSKSSPGWIGRAIVLGLVLGGLGYGWSRLSRRDQKQVRQKLDDAVKLARGAWQTITKPGDSPSGDAPPGAPAPAGKAPTPGAPAGKTPAPGMPAGKPGEPPQAASAPPGAKPAQPPPVEKPAQPPVEKPAVAAAPLPPQNAAAPVEKPGQPAPPVEKPPGERVASATPAGEKPPAVGEKAPPVGENAPPAGEKSPPAGDPAEDDDDDSDEPAPPSDTPGARLEAAARAAEAHKAEPAPHANDAHAAPHAADAHAAAHANEPHANEPHANEPHASDPHASDPHASDPHANDPHANDPHASDPHAAPPTGARPAEARRPAPAPVPARKVTLKDVDRALAAGKLDDAIQDLYVIRRHAPSSPAVALLLGHAYFRKLWRTDGLREYATALQLSPPLRRDRLLIHNAVAALDGPTFKLARSVIRARIGAAALPEVRRAARDSKNPKVGKRAARLAAELVHPAPKRRRR